MKKLILVLSLSMMMFSCNKKDDKLINSQANNRSNPPEEEIQNPYNWCGVLHNNTLDLLADNENFPNLDEYEVIAIIDEYYFNQTGDTNTLSIEDYRDSYNENAWPFSESMQIFLDSGYMTQSQYDYVVKLEEIYLADSAIDFALEQIHLLEVDLYNDENIDNDGKAYVWYILAISKYSYQYWYNGFTNEESPWYTVLNGSKMPFGRWCAVHAADFWGANHGFWVKGNGRDFESRIILGDREAANASYQAGLQWDENH